MAPTTTSHRLTRIAVGSTLMATVFVAVAPALGAEASTGSKNTKSAQSSTSTKNSTTTKNATAQLPRFGDKGDAVLAVQNALMSNGFTLRGGATGVFDKNTRTTLRNFQKVVGLKVTGRVDAATAKVLKLNVAAAPTNATATFPFTMETLPKRGASGDAVVVVQNAIQNAGTNVRGGIDGVFGLGVTKSIEDFQRAKGLPVNGLLDQATAQALGLVAAAPAPQASTAAAPAITLETLPVRGERGERVLLVQQALVKAGMKLKGGADGIFGQATTNTLKRYQKLNGLNATGVLDAATAYKLALIAAPSPEMQLSVFPVQGPCSFIDTWHAPREGTRLHIGVDIIAPKGNLVYAVADGTITRTYSVATDKRAGNGVRLTMADGTYFFYGHFDTIAPGIAVGSVVKAGQVIGTIGATGNTSTPHLHIEIHPGGGEAINPYPIFKAIDACNVTTPRPAPAQ